MDYAGKPSNGMKFVIRTRTYMYSNLKRRRAVPVIFPVPVLPPWRLSCTTHFCRDSIETSRIVLVGGGGVQSDS
jgi:hypothetical protein